MPKAGEGGALRYACSSMEVKQGDRAAGMPRLIGLDRSGGTLRAKGWNRLPIIRMTNISILPGEKPLTLEQLISSS